MRCVPCIAPLYRSLALCFVVTGLASCSVGQTTVTGKPAYPTDYRRDLVYVLQQEVFLIPSEGGYRMHYYARGPGKALNLSPESVADYEANKVFWSRRDVRRIRAGAKFRFVELVLDRNPEVGTMLQVVGQMLDADAPRGGRVELRGISHWKLGDLSVYVDSEYLQPEKLSVQE